MTHTPTPWSDPQDFEFASNPVCVVQPVDASANDGMVVAHFFGPERVANAGMVMQRVNSHDRLVEALQVARALMLQEADVAARAGQVERLEAGAARITQALEGL